MSVTEPKPPSRREAYCAPLRYLPEGALCVPHLSSSPDRKNPYPVGIGVPDGPESASHRTEPPVVAQSNEPPQHRTFTP